jgi:hypothetical protein
MACYLNLMVCGVFSLGRRRLFHRWNRRQIVLVLVSTHQLQRDMNKRYEAGFNRCIGVLCRWLGSR